MNCDRIISLDTGALWGGELTAIDLPATKSPKSRLPTAWIGKSRSNKNKTRSPV